MTTEYQVTVIETKEMKSFETIQEARKWVESVRKTFSAWGGDNLTFQCIRITKATVCL